MAAVVGMVYLPIRAMPQRPAWPSVQASLTYRPVELTPTAGPLQLAGAWVVTAADRRFSGLSSLFLDNGRFLAVSDRGAVARFDLPTGASSVADIKDLRAGPGPWGNKRSRDAESLAPDPVGRGWWIGYEQRHSLWLYDPSFDTALASVALGRDDWWDNRGAEALVAEDNDLLVLAENGRDAMRVGTSGLARLQLKVGADVADAARAPDGSIWLLLRSRGWGGIGQRIAPLVRTAAGYRTGQGFPVPKAAFDNFEGMAIAQLPEGKWRFWLISDDGHRVMARTLLVALDFVPPLRHDKSPAPSAGLSR